VRSSDVPRDLSAISEERAHELLTQFGPAVEAEVRAFTSVGARMGLEVSDLRQFARLAVLDAVLTYNGRSSLRYWVHKKIRWGLIREVERPEQLEPLPEEPLNGENPEELLERLELVGWVRGAVDGLEIRQRTILACRLQGETMREVAASLGISPTRVHQESTRAISSLRRLFVLARGDARRRARRLVDSEHD